MLNPHHRGDILKVLLENRVELYHRNRENQFKSSAHPLLLTSIVREETDKPLSFFYIMAQMIGVA